METRGYSFTQKSFECNINVLWKVLHYSGTERNHITVKESEKLMNINTLNQELDTVRLRL